LELLIIVFFVAIVLQVIYLIVFNVALRKEAKTIKSINPQIEGLPVSIIICAHDEEENLRELIPQLLNQNYPEFEIIIVNDRSNDHTFDYMLSLTKNDKRIRLVNVDHIPAHVNRKKYSLTLGIRAAKHEWLLLTDADCRPAGLNWIAQMSSAFQESTLFVIGFSPYQKSKGFLNLFIRFETILTALQYISFALLKNPYMAVGRNLAYRKSFFLAEKGFNQYMNITGGDDDLFVNQHANGGNTKIIVGRDATIVTYPEKSWRSFLKQKTRHLSVGRYYKFKHKFWLGLFLFSWLIVWLTILPVALFSGLHLWILAAMLIRMGLLVQTLRTGLQRFGHNFELWTVPFLDFLFSIYYLTTGLITIGTKKVRWKN
jgi:cellulose synthase/poly-beta-1,6-N-acetylglucosamine synthase-like glycosyltransferase